MEASELEFITVGYILGSLGTKGEVKVEVMTDFPQRFVPPSTVYVNRQPMTITSSRWHKGKAVIKLNSIDGIEDTELLRGKLIEIHHSQLEPLPEGQFYHFQLIGLEVWTTQGKSLGRITEILTAQSNDNYVVNGSEGEILIPAIEDVVKSINPDKGYIIIEAIEGLLDLNKKAAKKTRQP